MLIGILLTLFAYRIYFKQSWQKSAFMALAGNYFLSAGLDYIFLFITNLLPDNLRFFIWGNLFVLRSILTLVYVLIFIYTIKLPDRNYSSFNYLISKYGAFYFVFFLFFAAYDLLHMVEFDGFLSVNDLTEFFSVALFLALFIHSLLYVRKDQNLEVTQRELEIEKLYAESQLKTLNDLRGYRQEINALVKIMRNLLKNKACQ